MILKREYEHGHMIINLQQYHYLWSLVSLQPRPLILSYAPPIAHQIYTIQVFSSR